MKKISCTDQRFCLFQCIKLFLYNVRIFLLTTVVGQHSSDDWSRGVNGDWLEGAPKYRLHEGPRISERTSGFAGALFSPTKAACRKSKSEKGSRTNQNCEEPVR